MNKGIKKKKPKSSVSHHRPIKKYRYLSKYTTIDNSRVLTHLEEESDWIEEI